MTKLTVGDKHYTVSVGDKEAVAQFFYCYKDEKKGVIPGFLCSWGVISRKAVCT